MKVVDAALAIAAADIKNPDVHVLQSTVWQLLGPKRKVSRMIDNYHNFSLTGCLVIGNYVVSRRQQYIVSHHLSYYTIKISFYFLYFVDFPTLSSGMTFLNKGQK